MAFWNVDLTTRDGAEGAARMGGVACFVGAGLAGLGLALLLLPAARAQPTVALIGSAAGVAAEILVFLVAGFRLRQRRGMVWGSVAALLLAFEMIWKVVTLTGIGGLIINAVMLVGIVNGIRGARALRDLTDPEDVAHVFE